ncbi:MAG: hypothetical protein HWE16_03265 [Gammaproteobacteria bacterium]|nr:hypothetical protein [Gammaproteobacteria bacterium]
MPLTIKFQQPSTSLKILAACWGFLIAFILVMLWLLKPDIEFYWLLLLIVSMILAALVSLRYFRYSLKNYQAVHWHEGVWYLLKGSHKTQIQIEANTRVLPLWILLEFSFKESAKSTKQKLFLPKDCMNDKDYRDLCRTLRFIEQESKEFV